MKITTGEMTEKRKDYYRNIKEIQKRWKPKPCEQQGS